MLVAALGAAAAGGYAAGNPHPNQGIHVSFCGEDGTDVAVTWFSGGSNQVGVQYGLASGALTEWVRGDAVPAQAGDLFIHRAKLTGLLPGQRYYYRCVTGAPAVTSQVCSFRAAPPAGKPVTFAVLGDIQVKGPDLTWRRAALWLAGKTPDFCLSLGDQVDRGLIPEQWRALLDDGAPLFETTVFMPLIGNHDCYGDDAGVEKDPSLYRLLFPLPDNGCAAFAGQWYAFRAGCASFAMLASYPFRNGETCDVRGVAEQSEWLGRMLAGERRSGWSFAALHPPIHSTGPHGRDTEWYQTLWGGILEATSVAVVFSGHTHAFEITRPLLGGKPVTDGSGGVRYYNAAGITYSGLATGNALTAARAQREREPLALIVTATADRLVLSTWNRLTDSVAQETVIMRERGPSQ